MRINTTKRNRFAGAPLAAWILFIVVHSVIGCARFPKLTNQIETKLIDPVKQSASFVSSRIPGERPLQARTWRPDLAVLPYAVFSGNEITLHNVRNCRYRTEDDYDVRHYNMQFKLSDVVSVDYLVVPFNSAPILAHTMVSFGLRDGRHFVISVEARLERDESYSATAGTAKKYELIYVVADEQDVLPLRTAVRSAEVYLYRGNATPDQVQDLLVGMLQRANKLSREPEFYDTLTNNCTTNLVDHVNQIRPGKVPLDLRVVLPGHSDSLAYKLGLLKSTELTFEDLKRQSNISALIDAAVGSPYFSQAIRKQR